VLKLENLSYEREDKALFSNLTLKISLGTFVNVVGPNGAGKTSLLKVLAGLWQPTTGSLEWDKKSLPLEAPLFWAELLYIGHQSQLQPTLTPLQNLKWWITINSLERPTIEEIEAALVHVGLKAFLHLPCEMLSRGQRQRVLLARLWVSPPLCWILDEPFTALDEAGILAVKHRFEEHLLQSGIIIVATHQPLRISAEKSFNIALQSTVC
jgi:heme exporter protein A